MTTGDPTLPSGCKLCGVARAARPGSLISADLGCPCAATRGPKLRPARDAAAALRLLDELEFPSRPLEQEADAPLADLNAVLAADYRTVRGFPRIELASELKRIVDNFIMPYGQIWQCWQDRRRLERLRRVFNWGDVLVNAEPYVDGAGLSLWGFSTDAKVQGRRKFLIFVNTAHDPGAVAATIGHELGHHIYSAIPGRRAGEPATGSILTEHFGDEQELFSDAVVAMCAYSHTAIREIAAGASAACDGANPKMAEQIRKAFATIDPHYRIDLDRADLTAPWRIRYLTMMVHFLKLRYALLDSAGI